MISQILIGYKNDESGFLSQSTAAELLGCHVNITDNPRGNCSTMEKLAEANTILNGSSWCSGSMINTTDWANNIEPLFLTARHCHPPASTNFDNVSLRFRYWSGNTAAGWRTYFGTDLLSSSPVPATPIPPLPSGDQQLLRTDFPIDPADGIFYIGWDRSATLPSTTSVVHHPDLADLKISLDAQAVTLNPAVVNFGTPAVTRLPASAAFQTNYGQTGDFGVIEGGSSGSMLQNPAHLAIGVCTGGFAVTCSNKSGLQFFHRLFSGWGTQATPAESLAPWLDPINSGTTSQQGAFEFYPGSTSIPCAGFVQTITAPNVKTNSNVFYTYTWTSSPNISRTGSGASITFSGIASRTSGTQEWIECAISAPTSCGSIIYRARRVFTWVPASNFQVTLNSPSFLCAGNSYSLNLASQNTIQLPVNGVFNWTFSGITGTSTNGGRTISLFASTPNSSGTATLNITTPACLAGPRVFYFSVSSCSGGGWLLKPNSGPTEIVFWPNPSAETESIKFRLPDQADFERAEIIVRDVSGRIICKHRPAFFEGDLPMFGAKKGIYFIETRTSRSVYCNRIVVD